jgi:hypothetical protein
MPPPEKKIKLGVKPEEELNEFREEIRKIGNFSETDFQVSKNKIIGTFLKFFSSPRSSSTT